MNSWLDRVAPAREPRRRGRGDLGLGAAALAHQEAVLQGPGVRRPARRARRAGRRARHGPAAPPPAAPVWWRGRSPTGPCPGPPAQAKGLGAPRRRAGPVLRWSCRPPPHQHLVLDTGQHYVCVCVRACFHVVLHVSGTSGIQITSLEHMLASLSLFVSCLLVLARLRREPLLPCLGLCPRLYCLIGLSFFVLMHTISSFGICQGMSWQHLNQPCVAGYVYYLSLSLSLSMLGRAYLATVFHYRQLL